MGTGEKFGSHGMKIVYTYIVGICVLIFFVLAAAWFGYSIADACNTCCIRATHAVRVRDKMRRCVKANYKKLSEEYAASTDTVYENGQGSDTVWSPVGSESYGPQRQVKKRRQQPTKPKRRARSRSMVSEGEHKDLMTHRGAPFSLPLDQGSFWVSSRFGPRRRPDGSPDFHYGLDLAANKGTPVHAARSGVVLYAGWDNGYGNTVLIKHGTHFKTRYAHLDRILARTGDTVVRGACIGRVGATGNVRKKGGDGSHLHFEVHYQGKRVDPLQFLPDFVS